MSDMQLKASSDYTRGYTDGYDVGYDVGEANAVAHAKQLFREEMFTSFWGGFSIGAVLGGAVAIIGFVLGLAR